MAEEGERIAALALEKQALYIGRGLRLIIAGLAPSVILIAGEITSAWHRFGPTIEKEATENILGGKPPRILPSHEGDIARLRGAAALVFQRGGVREKELEDNPGIAPAGRLAGIPGPAESGVARDFSPVPAWFK
jgi:predicted NBD/HSP70 family sugar kinase